VTSVNGVIRLKKLLDAQANNTASREHTTDQREQSARAAKPSPVVTPDAKNDRGNNGNQSKANEELGVCEQAFHGLCG
jgi:hypothetical protein